MKWEEEAKTVSVDGDWVISVIGKQHEKLANFRTNVLRGHRQPGNKTEGHPKVAVDLSMIESIDASGCQLLSSFLKVVERDGFEPRVTNLPEPLRHVFESLGYLDCIRSMIDKGKQSQK